MLPASESEVTVPSLESSYARIFGMIQPARKAGNHTGTVTVVNTGGRNGRRLVVTKWCATLQSCRLKLKPPQPS